MSPKQKKRLLKRSKPLTTGKTKHKTFNLQQVIDALTKHKGQVTHTATYLGCSYRKLKAYIDENKKIQESLQHIDEGNIDHVESKLFNLIDKEDKTAIIFYLKTKGKKRGYIEDEKIDLSKLAQPITFIFQNAKHAEKSG